MRPLLMLPMVGLIASCAPRTSTAGPQPDALGIVSLTATERLCASAMQVGDTLTLAAAGRLPDASVLPPGNRVRLLVRTARASRNVRDPVRLDFEVLALHVPSSRERRIGGDVLHVTLVRARARDGAFDACIPEGGRVTIRLTEPNG